MAISGVARPFRSIETVVGVDCVFHTIDKPVIQSDQIFQLTCSMYHLCNTEVEGKSQSYWLSVGSESDSDQVMRSYN